MNPKEKAKELIKGFIYNVYKTAFVDTDDLEDRWYLIDNDTAKQCSLIAVDEMINILVMVFDNDDTKTESYDFMDKRIKYLEEVRQELLKS